MGSACGSCSKCGDGQALDTDYKNNKDMKKKKKDGNDIDESEYDSEYDDEDSFMSDEGGVDYRDGKYNMGNQIKG